MRRSSRHALLSSARSIGAIVPMLAGCGDGRLGLQYPWVFAIGVVACAVIVWRSQVARPAMAFTRVEEARSLPITWRVALSRMPLALRLVAVIALTIAVARPQVESFDRRATEGVDLFLVLDMSGSMSAVDMHPNAIQRFQVENQRDPPNRFDNAIATLKRFVAGRSRDRIGMVVFAVDAYLQFPLTLDYSTIQTLLDRLHLHQIEANATAIGNGLGVAIRGLLGSEAQSRAIILITDGKQQGGNVSPRQAMAMAAEEGIIIYTILVGGQGPTMAPSNLQNRDGTRRFVQQDYPVDPELLREIASTTGGEYYLAAAPEELEGGLNAILDRLETTAMEDVTSVRPREVFVPFALAALLALAFEALIAWLLARRFP